MKLRRRKYKSGKIGWQLDYGTVNGRRKQVAYTDEKKANEAYKAALKLRQKHGDLGAMATPADVAELTTARMRLNGVSLLTAVEYYLANAFRVTAPLAMRDAVAAFHLEMIARGRSRRTRETMRCSLRPFALRHAVVPVHQLTRDHILTVLKGNAWSKRTQLGYLGHLRTFLSWARDHGHAVEDPSKGIVIGTDHTDIGTLTLEQCEAILTAALDSTKEAPEKRSLLGYIVLGMFCGLRRAEIERLRWTDIRLTEKLVVISSGNAKTRMRRVVDISKNALAWLKLDPAHNADARVCPADFKEMWRDLRATAGINEWPNNALRHTYASMHYAQHQNENLLAAQMGNSPLMIHRHYRALSTKPQAAQFWALMPPKK
ncbi:MAG: tyrosine-type recombinase/integrase [Verrucomicrobia bacterium]|nr:tyrosine-type recombinase/integrase [Verrucomicrobiota bacterium]